MNNITDHIQFLIDKNTSIIDIDNNDKFILNILNNNLNENLDYHLNSIGIIFEESSIRDGILNDIKTIDNELTKYNNKLEDYIDMRNNIVTRAPSSYKYESDKKVALDALERINAGIEEFKEQIKNAKETKQQLVERLHQIEKTNEEANQFLDTFNINDYEDDPERLKELQTKLSNLENLNPRQQEAIQDILKQIQNRLDDPPFIDNKINNSNEKGFFDSVSNAVSQNPLLALGTVVLVAAGAYLIYKYVNSIYRLNKAFNYYNKKFNDTSDPKKKQEYKNKMEIYKKKLEEAKAKARENKKEYISKTKKMETQLISLKKSKGNIEDISKLEKKLVARKKVLAKIGAL